MYIAILQFEVEIPGALSLKDKRRVAKSIKDRFHREHLCAVAEVGALEDPRLALMALSIVGPDRRRIRSAMDAIEHKLKSLQEGRLGDTQRRIISVAELDHAEDDDTPVFSASELDAADPGLDTENKA